jgi:hypothetical protein
MSGKGAKGLSGKGLSGKGAKGTMSSKKGDKRKPTSRSVKAGLQFPVGRIHRFLKVIFFLKDAFAAFGQLDDASSFTCMERSAF